MLPKLRQNSGMTLIELTVAMAVTFIVAGAIFATYRAQQMTHTTQRALVEMNQNIRSAAYFLSREFRQAGSDFSWSGNFGITIANQAEIQFQIDRNRNGLNDGGDETVRYALTNDADGDGIADGFPCHLGRQVAGGNTEIIAENIEAIDFEYLGYSAVPPYQTVILNPAAGPINVPAGQLATIRFVRVTIVARYGDAVPGMSYRQTDMQTYRNAAGTRLVMGPRNDTIRRTVLTTEIQMRNM